MKRINLITLVCALIAIPTFAETFKPKVFGMKYSEVIDERLSACATISGPYLLKYDTGYTFNNKWNNGSNKPVYINRFEVKFVNREFLSAPKEPTFGFTSTLAELEYAVPPKTSVKYLKSSAPFKTVKYGEKGSAYDFALIYKTYYDFNNTPDYKYDDSVRVDCETYKVNQKNNG